MRASRIAVIPLFLSVVALLSCALDDNCETATKSMEGRIKSFCDADPAYMASPFCVECVSRGFYAVDELCNCRSLKFDVDFCYYDDTDEGNPKVRDALDYARSVCRSGAHLPEDKAASQVGDEDASSSVSSGAGGSGGVGGVGGAGGVGGN